MTTAPWAARRALTVLLPAPMPPVRPSRNTEGGPSAGAAVAVRGDVHVVHVVGRGTAAIAHASPAARRGRPPDLLLPDEVVDSELAPVLLQECCDLVARGGVHHDVERAAGGVVSTAAAGSAVAADGRELRAHGTKDAYRVRLQ